MKIEKKLKCRRIHKSYHGEVEWKVGRSRKIERRKKKKGEEEEK